MRIKIYLSVISIFTLLILITAGCVQEEDSSKYKSDLKANASDLDGHYYKGYRYQLYFKDDKMLVIKDNIIDKQKSPLDALFVNEENKDKSFTSTKEYQDIKIKTKGNKYYITVDDVTLEFIKFKEHIIVDSEDVEYIRNSFDK